MRSRSAVIGALALAAALAGCNDTGGSDTTGGQSDSTTTSLAAASTTEKSGPTAQIVIANIAYDAPASVAAGTTVTVENQDNISHTFTSPDDVFDSGTIRPGDTFEVTFSEPGEYAFFCRFHPDRMMGTITVEG